MDEWLSLASLVGMATGAWGAYRLYTADRPTAEWVSDLFATVAERPTKGVVAPDGYDPTAERESAMERARQVERSMQRFSVQAKSGIGWVLTGFVIQAMAQALEMFLSGTHF